VRELREFRAHHPEFVAAGATVVSASRDSVESNRHWTQRLSLPFPLLSDRDGSLGKALGVVRTLRVGAWSVEFLRRSTLLAGTDGLIAAVWSDVKIRGHAREVLAAALALRTPVRPEPSAQ
jgi:peroxiredoxin Q/BCP